MSGLFGRIPLRWQPRAESVFADDLRVSAVVGRPDGRLSELRDGVIDDLSSEGASLRCDKPIEKGWLVRMTLPLPLESVGVAGRIVHRRKRNAPHGAVHVHGVHFRSLDAHTTEAIQSYCAQRTAGRARTGVGVVEPSTIVNAGDRGMSARILEQPKHQPLAPNAPPLLTVLGAVARIDGKFNVAESIEIQCDVVGQLEVGGTLVIGEFGNVAADVRTANAIIRGRYTGNLKASGSIEIASNARVTGTVESSELAIARGAVFTGTATHVEKEAEDKLADSIAQAVTEVGKPIAVALLEAEQASLARANVAESSREQDVRFS